MKKFLKKGAHKGGDFSMHENISQRLMDVAPEVGSNVGGFFAGAFASKMLAKYEKIPAWIDGPAQIGLGVGLQLVKSPYINEAGKGMITFGVYQAVQKSTNTTVAKVRQTIGLAGPVSVNTAVSTRTTDVVENPTPTTDWDALARDWANNLNDELPVSTERAVEMPVNGQKVAINATSLI